MTPPPAGPAREARFRRLVEETYADLLRFARRRVEPSAAEDVVADVLLVAWRRLDDLPAGTDDARAWLFGVARATVLNTRRGDRRRDALAVRIGDATIAAVDGSDEAATVAVRLDLTRAWARLGPSEQEVIALAVWDGLTSPQAAAVLGCSATAYRLRLSRARRALRRHLDHPSPATTSGGLRR